MNVSHHLNGGNGNIAASGVGNSKDFSLINTVIAMEYSSLCLLWKQALVLRNTVRVSRGKLENLSANSTFGDLFPCNLEVVQRIIIQFYRSDTVIIIARLSKHQHPQLILGMNILHPDLYPVSKGKGLSLKLIRWVRVNIKHPYQLREVAEGGVHLSIMNRFHPGSLLTSKLPMHYETTLW